MDNQQVPLKTALAMGAQLANNAALAPDHLMKDYFANKGHFDVVFECTGVGAVLKQAFPMVRPRGTIVQVGVTGSADIPVNALVGKEIRLIGSHRFHHEYVVATSLIRE